MDRKLILLSSLIVGILVLGLIFYMSQGVKRKYQAEVKRGLTDIKAREAEVLTKEDMNHLPPQVQKYLENTGAIGKPKIMNARSRAKGKMKMEQDKDWVEIEIEQYNFFGPSPARLSLIRTNVSGVPVIGLDSFVRRKGNMLIKIGGLIKVVDGKGKEMDQGLMVNVLNDMCILAPSTLIDPRITWEVLDTSKVKATLAIDGLKVSAVLEFNKDGQLINFVTDDRYFSPKGTSYERVRWSTPVREYKQMDGLKIATIGEGIWHFTEGEYRYAELKTGEIEYNCEVLK